MCAHTRTQWQQALRHAHVILSLLCLVQSNSTVVDEVYVASNITSCGSCDGCYSACTLVIRALILSHLNGLMIFLAIVVNHSLQALDLQYVRQWYRIHAIKHASGRDDVTSITADRSLLSSSRIIVHLPSFAVAL